MSIKNLAGLLGLCAALAACGSTTSEQALLGGSVGALGGVVVGANPVASAVVGAGANVVYCELRPSDCN